MADSKIPENYADVRYVCLSDMHMGAPDSLLTNLKTASPEPDPSQPSPVLVALVNCIRAALASNRGKTLPTLILNGDILELALSTEDQAGMVFQRFLELIMPPGNQMFGRIIYIPGNHDHHIWESARETQYVKDLASVPITEPLPKARHNTNIFVCEGGKPLSAYLPTRLAARNSHLANFVIETAYPNLGVRSEDGKKFVLFHHGQYVEPIYWFVSTLKTMLFPKQIMPATVAELEAENFAWIDFLWSLLGRSGQAGLDTAVIHYKMLDEEKFGELLDNLAESVAAKWSTNFVGEKIEAAALKVVLRLVADHFIRSERQGEDVVLGQSSEKALWWYVNELLRRQIEAELAISAMPPQVAFVFGHTHKPFEQDINFANFPKWVDVYNTGGWTVDGVDPLPKHGGSVVLVDDDLNVTSLRMYNEYKNFGSTRVSVREAHGASTADNSLTARMKKLVAANKDPWKTFTEVVRRAIYVREQNLRARINESVD